MRADVKLGLATSVVVILLAGWYFFDQDASQSTILIPDGDSNLTLFQPETREKDIVVPRESPARETLAATPAPQTVKSDPPPMADDKDKPSGLADLFKTDRDPSRPVDEQDAALLSEEPMGVAAFTPPPPTAAPDAQRMETHTVQPGDTMAELARRYYGGTRYLRPLIDANPHIVDSATLVIGDVINLPDIDPIPLPPAETKPATNGGQTHTVVMGDTLYRIALSRLGEASRWNEIYELNKDAIGEDTSALKIGLILELPPR